jgi:hypothetical protein
MEPMEMVKKIVINQFSEVDQDNINAMSENG